MLHDIANCTSQTEKFAGQGGQTIFYFQQNDVSIGFSHLNADMTRQDCDVLPDRTTVHSYYNRRGDLVGIEHKRENVKTNRETTDKMTRCLHWVQLGDNLKAMIGLDERTHAQRTQMQGRKVAEKVLGVTF